MVKLDEKETLFMKGVECFNNKEFYDAHEFWEDLWLNYKLEDAKFVQGLIQLAVSYFHFFNKNLNGARSMMKKCLTKFEPYQRVRGVDVVSLKTKIIRVQNYFNEIEDTSIIEDSYILVLKVMHE